MPPGTWVFFEVMSKNLLLQLHVESCAFGGDGVTHHEGRVIFVPGTLPGETVIAEIVSEKNDFSRARVHRIENPSPDRIAPLCPLAGICPGCHYLHASPEAETRCKAAQFAAFLETAGGPPDRLDEPLLPGTPLGYRNKMVLHVNKESGTPQVGYVGADMQSVTPVSHCLLANDAINADLAAKLADPGFFHSIHHRMKLTWRHTERNGVIFFRNQPPKRASWLREKLRFGEISVPAGGFFQINPAGAQSLVDEFTAVLREHPVKRVIDLYCGAGLFAAAAAAAGVPEVMGAETDADAVNAARYNLKQYGQPEAHLLADDAARALPELLRNAPEHTLLAVDPPRAGLSGTMRRCLLAQPPGRLIVYISCHPATWARDAAALRRGGCRLLRARLINQFCRTGHFEIFSLFRRENDHA